MRKFVPGIILLAMLAAIVAFYEPDTTPPETYGQVARRECWKEASKNDRDQEECYSKKLVVKALQMQSAQDSRR